MFYVKFIVTTKQRLSVDSQKIKRRKSEHSTTENNQFTKGGSRKKRNCKTARKQSIRWYQ
jgi:hypothetical protein